MPPVDIAKMDARALGYYENTPKIYKRLLGVVKDELTAEYLTAFDTLEKEIARLLARIYDDDPVVFRNNLYKYGRFDALQKEVAGILRELGKNVKSTIDRSIVDGYRVDYYYHGYITDVVLGVSAGFTQINDKAVRAALAAHYDFSNYEGSVNISIDKFNESIKYTVTQAAIQGHSIPKVAKEIKAKTDIAYSNAERIARTEVLRASSVGGLDADLQSKAFLEKNGITQRRFWMATLDERTRETHAIMDSKEEDKDGYFILPGGYKTTAPRLSGVAEHDINCFPADTPVSFDSKIKRVYKRYYDGKMLNIKLRSGINFSVTPNHPILTERGFIAAQFLNVGDNLVKVNPIKVFFGAYRNPQNTPTVTDKVFRFFYVMASGVVQRVTGVNIQFHGDGMDGDVDIVNIDSFLENRFKTFGFKKIKDKFFAITNKGMSLLFGFSGFDVALDKKFFGFIPYRLMRGLSVFNVFRFTSMFHHKAISVGVVSAVDTGFAQCSSDNTSGNGKHFSNLIFRNSGFIKIRDFFLRHFLSFRHDRVLSIDVSHYSGYVYNFETESGTYNITQKGSKGKGIIVHNCRCSTGVKFKELPGKTAAERRAKFADGKRVIPANISFTEWAKMTDIKLTPTVQKAITGRVE